MLSSHSHGNAWTRVARGSRGVGLGLPGRARCLDQRAVWLQWPSALQDPHDLGPLSYAPEERYRALGRRWDTARVGDELDSLSSHLTLEAAQWCPGAREAITDRKNAFIVSSVKPHTAGGVSGICAAAQREQTLVPPAQLSDRYRATHRASHIAVGGERRAYRDAPHVSQSQSTKQWPLSSSP